MDVEVANTLGRSMEGRRGGERGKGGEGEGERGKGGEGERERGNGMQNILSCAYSTVQIVCVCM